MVNLKSAFGAVKALGTSARLGLGRAKHVAGGFSLVLGAFLIGMAPATATTLTYDFTPLTNHDIGSSATFTESGIIITVSGFASSTFHTAVDLYSKAGGGDENGLGLINDPSGDHEISGSSLIRVALPTNYTDFSFKLGSSTSGEGWLVYGSNSATSGYVLVASGTDENDHVLTGCTAGLNDGCYQYYYFAYDPSKVTSSNTNILLSEIDLNVSAVPLPGALPLFASGLGMLGYLASRKRRRQGGAA